MRRDVKGEPLTLSVRGHMAQLSEQARAVLPDIIMIDTMSAAFATKSENDNAEISRLIMKPVVE